MSIDGVLKLNAQVLRGKEAAIGPGKALVLEAIVEHGSISAAGRALGMSYRRAWMLANDLNQDWREPVFEAAVGGGQKAGARLTPFGEELLTRFRAMEAAMMNSVDDADRAWFMQQLKTPEPEAPKNLVS